MSFALKLGESHFFERLISRWNEWIVLGGARSEKPRSKSARAGAKPGGFEAPVTIPSSLGY